MDAGADIGRSATRLTENRLPQYLDEIARAADNACAFTRGMNYDEFLSDKRTQQAVMMSVVIIGEASAKIMDRYPTFAAVHSDLPWQAMRGFRNRVVHGYDAVDLKVVWNTVQIALPNLLRHLPSASE